MIIINNFINIFLKIAFSAFISHGFLDFWPLFNQWKWKKSLPAYIIFSLIGIYLYVLTPSFILLAFFISSAYHFGSDWSKSHNAMFLGSTLIGIATYNSSLILEDIGVPHSILFGGTFAISGIISLIPSIQNKAVYFMFPLSFFGIHGVMFYSIFIHTPRSVYLLANKYGNNIYIAWVLITIFLYSLTVSIEYALQYYKISFTNDIIIGLMFGILFSHMICTAGWREDNKKLLS